jgi:integrase
MAKTFTALSIEKMRPDPDKRREIHDGGCRGLYLHIQPSGTKSWTLLLARPNGRIGKLHLGPVDLSGKEAPQDQVLRIGTPLTLAGARALAAELYRRRDAGKDVITDSKAAKQRNKTAAADRVANVFGAIAREFFANYKTKKWNSRPRRWRDDAAALGLRYKPGGDPAKDEPEVIKGSLVATWAERPITDITKYDVDAAVDDARKHGSAGRARAMYSALSVLFGWLPLKYRVEVSPMLGTRSKPGAPARRERKLDQAEIVIFWKACDAIDRVYGALYQTLLLTGCRLREPGHMARTELGDHGVWEVPSGRTKNHLPFLVPLPPLALKIINSVPPPSIKGAGSNSGLVFSLNGKTPVSGFSKMKKALDTKMAEIAGKPIKPWRVHDLRRTFSTTLNESPDDGGLGIAPHIVEACLNHVSGGAKSGVAGTYNAALYLSEKRTALQRWAVHVEGLVSGRKADVRSLDAARKKKPK